jgi:hypothetical protein
MAALTRPTIVDHSALRVNQACIIAGLALGFLLNSVWLVAFVCLVMAVGTAVPSWGLFKALYARVLRPAGIVRPDTREDDPAAHLFAQGMGAGVLLLSLVALVVHATALGWALVFVVIALALVNLLAGFCAGCFVYFQLGRRGLLPGKARALPGKVG